MKTAGIILAVIGGLMTLSGDKLALTKYDLTSTQGVSHVFGGIGVSVGLLAVGLVLYAKGKKKDDEFTQ